MNSDDIKFVSSEDVTREFFENFNAKDAAINLSLFLHKIIGVLPEINIEVKPPLGNKNIVSARISSNNLAIGMVPKMFEYLRIHDFGQRVNTNDHGGRRLDISVHYTYNHFGGGSNGSNICEVTFDVNGVITSCSTDFTSFMKG